MAEQPDKKPRDFAAFPLYFFDSSVQYGMSVREWYATFAMQSIIDHDTTVLSWSVNSDKHKEAAKSLADRAFSIADAMLERACQITPK